MPHVTARRLQKIQPILVKYREELIEKQRFNARAFESELRDTLNFQYTSIKTFVPELCKYPEHLHVAAYYLEHATSPGPISEFKVALAKVYGVRSYHGEKADAARKLFWGDFFASES